MVEYITRQYVTFTSYLRERQEGATAVEYGIMVALIAAVIVLTVKALGEKVDAAFTTVNGALP